MIHKSIIKKFAIGDSVADHYSKSHQSGGYYKKMGVRFSHAIPLPKQAPDTYLEKELGMNGTRKEKDYGRLASQSKKVQKTRQRKYSGSDDDSDDSGESKRVINPKKKKCKKSKKESKYKRNRIDEALGSDTYKNGTIITSRRIPRNRQIRI